MTATSTARINMRLAPSALETIREAAEAQQQDVTSFVLGAALDRARDVVTAERITRLTAAETREFEAALAREPRVIPELAEMIRRAQELRPD
jgi:uncharacterized protein (DUF1778 family)